MNRAIYNHLEDLNDVVTTPGEQAESDVVSRSWVRSANTFKVDPASEQAPVILTEQELREAQNPMSRLIRVAQSELDHLYALVRPARYVILLCDKNGIVVDHRGEEAEAAQFKHWGTWLGGVWSEDTEGTNGIGTCITERRPVTIHMSEHFRARHISLSCSGAPIFDPDGQFLGVLDVSSINPHLSSQSHALTGPVTTAAARAIEERLFREQFRRAWIIVLRIPEPNGVAIMLAVDGDRRVVGAGWRARSLLSDRGFPFSDNLHLWSLFERNERLFAHKDQADLAAYLEWSQTGELWPAIVTPPEVTSIRTLSTSENDFQARPRRQILVSGHWAPDVPQLRGGLSPMVLRRVYEYAEDHLHEKIDVSALAAVAGLSTFHFARAFKQSEGVSPHRFILERRLAKARKLLEESDRSLSDIAVAVGFADQSHFTHRFREAVGVSPRRYRKQHG